MAVREEQTGWRDEEFSRMHHSFPEHLLVCDVDFLEYRHGREAVALIEAKKRTAHGGVYPRPVVLREENKSQHDVLLDLGKRAKVPVFCVTYVYEKDDVEEPYSTWGFFILPLNEKARRYCPEDWVDREGYVKFLDSL